MPAILAIGHYYDRYDDPALPPIWAVTEAVTFGTLSKLFADLTLSNRKLVARTFGYDENVPVSWFRSLNDFRSKCAHHNRVWNANFASNQPMVARGVRQVFGPQPRTDLFYARAVILAALLDAVGRSGTWKQGFVAHIRTHQPLVDEVTMECPPGWTAMPFWAR